MNAAEAGSTGISLERKQTNIRRQIALVLLVTLMIAYIDRLNISILVVDPAFLRDMGIANDPTAKGMLMTVFLICYGIGNILFSPLGDWLGPRKAMLISIALWSVALAVGGAATGFAMLMASRVLLGFGESIHFPLQSTFVKNWFPAQERGKANATWLIGLNAAPLVAMPLFAATIPVLGWRGNFFFLVILGLLPIFLIWRYTADHPHLYKGISRAEKDYIQAELEKEKASEIKVEADSIWTGAKALLTNYRFWGLIICYSGINSIWWGTLTWLPSYLKEARGFSWAAMGAFSTMPYILSIAVKMFTGYATDRFGRLPLFLAASLLGSALFIYAGAYATSHVAAAVLLSCGISALALGSPPVWSLLQQLVPARTIGAGSGIMSGISLTLSSLTPVAVGILISHTGNYVGGLLYLVGWGIIGGAIALLMAVNKR